MKGRYDDLLAPGFRCPEGVPPFELTARLIPVAGDPSDLPAPAARVHGWMMAKHAETGQPITKSEVIRTLGRESQMHGGGPWAFFLDNWPLEHLYDASLLYEEPAGEVEP
ncbi:hypothetical protein PQA73_gp48 [Erwinia phage Pavtok]|uniref:Uncharacterized protein n=1 Tax=Erwinia phage Pavtok TaxID=2267655 RepID=A0A345BM05_9CAUD|nr:hypothetical protein PQA73_gp48 [Erwinia phage Pavtok]AXF51476.1 hypothetical protein PAVTOK_48 [Erwinia phage Pavtok]